MWVEEDHFVPSGCSYLLTWSDAASFSEVTETLKPSSHSAHSCPQRRGSHIKPCTGRRITAHTQPLSLSSLLSCGCSSHSHSSVLSTPGEGNGNPLQCSCMENPRDKGTWWASISGVAQMRTWLKRLSSSSSSKSTTLWDPLTAAAAPMNLLEM